MAGAIALCCLLSAPPAVAQQRTYDIPAGDAARALLLFARQSGLQIIAPANQLRGLKAPAIRGRLDARAVLEGLLAGTGLVVASDNGATIVLRRGDAVPGGRRDREAEPGRASRPGRFTRAAPQAPGGASPPAPPDAVEVERLVVTGTRLQTRAFSSPTPITELDAEALARRAAPTLAEALNELPIFRASASPSTMTRTVTGNSVAQGDLRGLGPVRTLMLVNGRRFPPVSVFGFAADMSQIPASMVERVEVVTGGASAAYGSDAVAGVVNFILDSRLTGLKASVQSGVTQRGDQRETVASVAYGVEAGRLRIALGGDFAKDRGAGSFYTRRLYADETGLVGRISATSPAQSIVPGVESTFPSGGIITAGPLRGTAFSLDGAPYAFAYGDVVGNNQIGATSNYGHNAQLIWQLRHPYERKNAMATATFEVSETLQVFAEAIGAINTSGGGYGDTLQSTFVVGASNPFLPAAVRAQLAAAGQSDFVLGRFNDDVSPYVSQQAYRTGRLSLGARGVLGAGADRPWRWEGYLQLGRTHQRNAYAHMLDIPNFMAATYVTAGPDDRAACGPLATNPNITLAQRAAVEPGCVPFNLFGQTNTAAALAYVTGTVRGTTRIRQDVAGVSFSGVAADLPAGPASVAFGAEFRREAVSADGDSRSRAGAWQVLNQATYAGATSVKEVFVEAGVPLLSQAPLAASLGVNGALRVADYARSGTEVTWKVGATWEPTPWLRLRVTRSRDIREPSLIELYGSGLTLGQSGVFNPFLQQTELRITTTPSGNPALAPEVADSLTAGLVLQPRGGLARDLRISVDYFRIRVDGVTGARTVGETIGRCFEGEKALCDQIAFDGAGHIINVNLPQLNFASLATEGVDVELAYRLDLADLASRWSGSLRVRNLTTLVTTNRRSDGVVTVERNGFSNGGTAKVTGNLTVDYVRDRASVGVQARYFSDVRWDPALIGPDDPAYNPALANSVSRNLFPGQVLFNLNASRTYVSGGVEVQVYAVINNLFDRRPSKQGAIAFNVSGVQYYDLLGRQFRAGIRVRL